MEWVLVVGVQVLALSDVPAAPLEGLELGRIQLPHLVGAAVVLPESHPSIFWQFSALSFLVLDGKR